MKQSIDIGKEPEMEFDNKLQKLSFYTAHHLIHERGMYEYDIFELTDFTYNILSYIEKNQEIADNQVLDYNDPIVEIEEVGEGETIDITVDKDHLFLANGVVTKNSFGLPMTADFMAGIVSTEDMQERGQFLFKQLKNRYVDPTFMKRFMVGVDYSKMRLYELENPLDGLYENEDKEEEQPQRSRRSKGKGRFADFDF